MSPLLFAARKPGPSPKKNPPRTIEHRFRLPASQVGVDYGYASLGGLHFGIMDYNYSSYDSAGLHPVTIWGSFAQAALCHDFSGKTFQLRSRAGYEISFISGAYSGFRVSAGHVTDLSRHGIFVSPELMFVFPARQNDISQVALGFDYPLLSRQAFPVLYRISVNVCRPGRAGKRISLP